MHDHTAVEADVLVGPQGGVAFNNPTGTSGSTGAAACV